MPSASAGERGLAKDGERLRAGPQGFHRAEHLPRGDVVQGRPPARALGDHALEEAIEVAVEERSRVPVLRPVGEELHERVIADAGGHAEPEADAIARGGEVAGDLAGVDARDEAPPPAPEQAEGPGDQREVADRWPPGADGHSP